MITTKNYIIEEVIVKKDSKIIIEAVSEEEYNNYQGKVGQTVKLGNKRPRSYWNKNRGLRKGNKVVIIGTDLLDGAKLFTVVPIDEYNSPDYDPEMDYQLVYPDELQL